MARRPNPDAHVLRLVTAKPNLLVPHFILHSYLYYEKDSPVIRDETFDEIVRLLDEKWDTVEHPHKHLIDRSLLKTGFYLQYPEIVKGAAEELTKELTGRGLPS